MEEEEEEEVKEVTREPRMIGKERRADGGRERREGYGVGNVDV